jgi:hypothetical protein
MMADSLPKLNDSSLYDNLKGEWLSSKGLLVVNQNGSLSFNGQTHNLVTYDLLPNNIWRFSNDSSVWGLIKNNSLFVTSNGKNYNFFRSLPSAPTRLVATAGYGYVDLSWSASSFDGGPSVAGYKIYVNGTTNPILTSETSKRIENLTAHTLYTFVVSAQTDVGEGQKSESASATPILPPPPTNLVASAGNTYVDLSWNAPSSGPSVSQYRIYVNGNYSTATTTSKRIENLTNNVSYSFSVSAVYSFGESSQSQSVSATPVPPPPPPPPTNLVASAGNTYVDLSWNASSDTSVSQYRIYVNGNYNTSSTTTSKRIENLTNNVSYSFSVSAVSSSGESSQSQSVSATPVPPPGPISPYRISVLSSSTFNVQGTIELPNINGYSDYGVYIDNVRYYGPALNPYLINDNLLNFQTTISKKLTAGTIYTITMNLIRSDGTETSMSVAKTFVAPSLFQSVNL